MCRSARTSLMPDVPVWGPPYPDPSEIRADVEAMVDAVAGALRDRFGDAIAGLWFKGSAQKRWDTPLDYVPEISDVDIHVRSAAPGALDPISDAEVAVAIHADIERRFRVGRPSPVHVPRVQFVPAEEVERLPGYVPVPVSAARTLYGPEHGGPGQVDQDAVVAADRDRLLLLADEPALTKATIDLVERPGQHLALGLRTLNWRVSPVGPLVLGLLGVDYTTTWSANRTGIIELLHQHGAHELATDYAAYYTSGWSFWLSGWRDGDAGRSAFLAAVRTINGGAALAKRTN